MPVARADHGDGIAPRRTVFGRGEEAAEPRLETEGLPFVRRHERAEPLAHTIPGTDLQDRRRFLGDHRIQGLHPAAQQLDRSEERRVGKEWRSRWSAEPEKEST